MVKSIAHNTGSHCNRQCGQGVDAVGNHPGDAAGKARDIVGGAGSGNMEGLHDVADDGADKGDRGHTAGQ